MPRINDQKELQKTLVDMHDFYYSRAKALAQNEHPSEEEVYEFGKMAGGDEAVCALYLGLYGGKALGELLSMTMEAYAEEDDE